MRFDLHFDLVNPLDQDARNAVFALDASRPTSVAGPQKLVNRLVKAFLTSRGSNPLHRKDGTDFTSLVNGNVEDPEDLEAAVTLMVQDAADQIKAIDQRSPWLAPNERLRAADLKTFTMIGVDRFEMTVELTTTSGDRVLALLPFALG